MTSAQRRFFNLREAVRASVGRMQAAVEAARKELVDGCDHPPEFVVDYRWEHDNGYGKQSWVTGKRCEICESTNNWGSTLWVKPHERTCRDD